MHEHSVIDQDAHFEIDEHMKISCATEVKALKRDDHASERYTFMMPRYIEGHDMLLCNKIEVHYNNIHYDIDTRETTTNCSFDEVEDFAIADDESVIWSWLVKGDATQLAGTLDFCIRFACIEDEKVTYQKFTEVYKSITVDDIIFNTEKVANEYSDAIQLAINNALAQAKESGDFNGDPGTDGNDGYTPQKGIDYYTEADKAEMVAAVLAALPDGDEVAY